jgi:hypothetical protein
MEGRSGIRVYALELGFPPRAGFSLELGFPWIVVPLQARIPIPKRVRIAKLRTDQHELKR